MTMGNKDNITYNSVMRKPETVAIQRGAEALEESVNFRHRAAVRRTYAALTQGEFLGVRRV